MEGWGPAYCVCEQSPPPPAPCPARDVAHNGLRTAARLDYKTKRGWHLPLVAYNLVLETPRTLLGYDKW